jgi:hypothetical protein
LEAPEFTVFPDLTEDDGFVLEREHLALDMLHHGSRKHDFF